MMHAQHPAHPMARAAVRGLTLIELLVALALMAVLTTLSWRVLDGMTRTQQHTQTHTDNSQAWQVAIAQWQADLDALQETGLQPAVDFNGRVLRLIRRAPASATEADNGLHVVAWALQPDAEAGNGLRWARWMISNSPWLARTTPSGRLTSRRIVSASCWASGDTRTVVELSRCSALLRRLFSSSCGEIIERTMP